MLHGPQRGLFDLEFRIPSECADELASGRADIGIVPSFELTRQDLRIIPGAGIASHGAVRSILLVSKVPAGRIRSLATDSSSRTSVQLARVILKCRFGVEPAMAPHPPQLAAMLERADAALVIGDPALHLDPAALPFHVYDLGAEWAELTGLPMVFAVWAGRDGATGPAVAEAFLASCRYGRERLEEIAREEAPRRGIAPELAMEYLTRNIVHELGDLEYRGLRKFLELAAGVESAAALKFGSVTHP